MATASYVTVPLVKENERFSKPLKPVIGVGFMFGPHAIFEAPLSILSVLTFYVLLAFMLGVASIAVFLRSDIDIWIQFSLYIVPLFAIICANRFFNSLAFRELLYRCIPSRAMLSSSIPDVEFSAASELADVHRGSKKQKRKWLKVMAYKSCFYPLFYEAIQWASYLIFQSYSKSEKGNDFAGNDKIKEQISEHLWLGFYISFWSIGLYMVGFFTLQFILVTNIIRRDAISFMSLFGDSPFLFIKKSHLNDQRETSYFFGALNFLFGIILMDAIEDKNDVTNFIGNYATNISKKRSTLSRNIPARSYDRGTPVAVECNDIVSIPYSEKEEDSTAITQEEASRMLANFVSDIDDITLYFTPFTTALLFFSVTNLVTHLCIFALNKSEIRYIWTLIRTIIWLLMTVRIIVATARVTNILGKISPHIKYLRATGALSGEDAKWENFLSLSEHFNLGNKTFGFPLTLKQVGILVAFLKMTFLVVLSLMRAPGNDLI
eukprot:gene8658-14674_t